MSKPGVQVSHTLTVDAARGAVAVIAGAAPSEPIVEALAREGLAQRSFDSVQAALDGAGSDAPAAVIVWVEDTISSMPGLIEPLSKRFAPSPVVVVCASIQRWEVRAALSAGAAGVIVSDDLASGLGPCLRAVRAGQICVPREHWRQVQPPVLSTREKQILGLVVMGYMNSQIATTLFLAESTVKSHLSSAFGKLGVRSRNEAVSLILDPDRGLGMGILGLVGGEPVEAISTGTR
jgi:DNA-binding NarL/FixJ family response regulator